MLEHWDEYLEENEKKYDFRWRKHWSNSEKKDSIVSKVLYMPLKSILLIQVIITCWERSRSIIRKRNPLQDYAQSSIPKNNYIINICYFHGFTFITFVFTKFVLCIY